jgi:hypothetical protein
MATTFSNKVAILNDLWLNHRFDKNLAEFVDYNDLGLPFANSISSGNEATPEMRMMINETFDSLLEEFSVEDTGFENIKQIVTSA